MSDTSVSPTAAAEQRTPSGIAIGYAMFGGIFAWLAHLIAMAGFTGRACATGQLWPFHVVTVVTLAFTAHALWVGLRIARGQAGRIAGAGGPTGGHRPASVHPTGPQAARILGWIAVALNIANLVLIVAEWTPVLFLSACAVG